MDRFSIAARQINAIRYVGAFGALEEKKTEENIL